MLNNYTSRIQFPIEASLPDSQVAIVSVWLHKLKRERVCRISNYMHALRNQGMWIFLKKSAYL